MYTGLLSTESVWLAMVAAGVLVCAAPVAAAVDRDVVDAAIIERNLFHPDRQKWEMPEDTAADSIAATVEKNLASVSLFGTVVGGDRRMAIMRAGKALKSAPGRRSAELDAPHGPYMEGDYIAGYRIARIEAKRVLLRDDSSNEEFEIFVSQEKADRADVKTPIPQQAAVSQAASEEQNPAARSSSSGTVSPPPPRVGGTTAKTLMRRLERHKKVLERRQTPIVQKQARRDLDKLEKLMPHLNEGEQRDIRMLKQELESML